MITDTIADLSQGDTNTAYFLMEAPDLLDQIEQELMQLRQDPTPQRIHTLMRAAHTLKGAAASVGLQGIKQVAHELESSFRGLYDPEVQIDGPLEALLYQGMERLRAPLRILLSGGQIADAQIWAQAEPALAELREHLGPAWGREIPLASALELGFDVAQSMFEMGVEQRLQDLEAALVDPEPDLLAEQLRTQAEIFIGLAESLDLRGFQGIATAAVAALDRHPDQGVRIAELVLRDLRQGQAAVLAGDRLRGGEVSPQLAALAGSESDPLPWDPPLVDHLTDSEANLSDLSDLSDLFSSATGEDQALLDTIWGVDLGSSAAEGSLDTITLETSRSSFPSDQPGWDQSEDHPIGQRLTHLRVEPEIPKSPSEAPLSLGDLAQLWGDLDLDALDQPQIPQQLISEPWELPPIPEEHAPPPQDLLDSDPDLGSILPCLEDLLVGVEGLDPLSTSLVPAQSAWLQSPPPLPPPLPSRPSPTIRIEVEKLETLDHLMGDLITTQHQQTRQQENLQATVRTFQDRLQSYRRQVMALQECSEPLWPSSTLGPLSGDSDPLEPDRLSQLRVLIQTLLEDSLQLEEVGEAVDLYTRQSGLTQERHQRLLTQTRDTLIAARRVPLRELFQRFVGLVQYLSTDPDKSAQLSWQGEQVWVDKAIAERLYDPLLHLVRNAFAHGIEPAPIRRQQGKPAQGQIQIRALQQGSRLTVEVWDDGQGLPFDQIRQRAIATQRISPDQAGLLSPDQMIPWLFEPGFTTAEQLSDLSGRGIGLDVVRSQLQAIGGEVQVESHPQQGTCFALQIPLGLTLTQLLLCQADQRPYALLMEAIHQILLPTPDRIQTLRGQRTLRWGTPQHPRLIPIHRLIDLLPYSYPWPAQPFGSTGSASDPPIPEPERPLVILQRQAALFALEVEEVIGEQELVIKPLAPLLQPPAYVHGCSPLGDGRLALVIDGVELMIHTLMENPIRPDRSPPPLHPDPI